MGTDQSALELFLTEASVLLPGEALADLPEGYLPVNAEQQEKLYAALAAYQLGGVAEKPYTINWPKQEKRQRVKKATQQDLIGDDGPEPRCCSSLCILNDWGRKR